MKKNIVANGKIIKGEKITSGNLTFKRAKGALSQEYYETILGRVANKDIDQNKNITLRNIS